VQIWLNMTENSHVENYKISQVHTSNELRNTVEAAYYDHYGSRAF
jgi:hypothetical protein